MVHMGLAAVCLVAERRSAAHDGLGGMVALVVALEQTTEEKMNETSTTGPKAAMKGKQRVRDPHEPTLNPWWVARKIVVWTLVVSTVAAVALTFLAFCVMAGHDVYWCINAPNPAQIQRGGCEKEYGMLAVTTFCVFCLIGFGVGTTQPSKWRYK